MARRRLGLWWLVGGVLIALALAGCGTASSSSGGEEEESGLTNEGSLASPVELTDGVSYDGMVGPGGFSYYLATVVEGTPPQVVVVGASASIGVAAAQNSDFAGGEDWLCEDVAAPEDNVVCTAEIGLTEAWVAIEDLDGEGAEYTITVTFGGGG